MIRSRILSALLFAILVGSIPAPGDDSRSGANAKVFIYRYKQLTGAALAPSVYCDEVQLARMDNGRYFVASISPGKHVFRSNDAQSGVEMETLPGKEYYIRVELATGFLKGHGRLVEATPEQGAYEIKRLKLLDPDKVKDPSRVLINGEARDAGTKAGANVLTNKDVIALKSAGLGDDLVIAKIKESQSDFSFGTEDLISLKKANVSDLVISEMMSSAKKNNSR
jgi:Protein of unknown function (DUF2846)